ncbi:hypothetical protein BGI09_04350 [Snodgrassella alvi]|nr:hypothetical protein BGI09_04350 [Snodgrassella alvi]
MGLLIIELNIKNIQILSKIIYILFSFSRLIFYLNKLIEYLKIDISRISVKPHNQLSSLRFIFNQIFIKKF